MIAPDRMLMNRFGPSFGTLTPHDVLTLDFRGNIVEDHTPKKNARVNETVELHGVIHRHNPQLVCALHTLPPATVTFSALRKVPEIDDQESCICRAMPRTRTSPAAAPPVFLMGNAVDSVSGASRELPMLSATSLASPFLYGVSWAQTMPALLANSSRIASKTIAVLLKSDARLFMFFTPFLRMCGMGRVPRAWRAKGSEFEPTLQLGLLDCNTIW
ncbi:MAG: class II aldolase/adducin family protein [Acidobacteriota bacterium]|nr:class II aldolase/adducin family protein [Acidobacteriota bacterium]